LAIDTEETVAETVDLDKFLAETSDAPVRQQRRAGDVSPDAFDMDKFLAETAPANPRAKTAGGESFLRGAGQGASLGFGDELYGVVGAIVNPTGSDKPFADRYRESRDFARRKDATAQLDNPKLYGGGAVTGGIMSAIVPGAVAAKAGQAMNTVKGAAAIGGLTGAGMSDADPLKSSDELKRFGLDVGKGAATGAVFQKGFQLLGKVANKFRPSELEKTANIKTLKAAGYMGPELKAMSEAEKQTAGRTLHDLGIVKAFDSLDDVATKAGAAKEKSGQAIGEALDSVDDLVARSKAAIDEGRIGGQLPPQAKANLKAAIDKQFQFNMSRIGQRIEKELIGPNGKNPLLKGEMAKLQGIADDFKAGGSLSMREGNVIKGTQGKVTNFNSDTVPQAFKKEVYDIIKTEIDDIVAKTGNLEGAVGRAEGKTLGNLDVAGRNKSVSDAFQQAKKEYGVTKQTTDIAQRRLGQLQANREVSLTDTIAAVGGLATGNPVAPLALGGLNKLARQYGDSVMAVSARKAARILERSPKALGKFADVLEAAAKRGGPALNATHLKLMKDPEYLRALSADGEDKDSPMQRRLRRTGE
jgi:hypothetical protein